MKMQAIIQIETDDTQYADKKTNWQNKKTQYESLQCCI